MDIHEDRLEDAIVPVRQQEALYTGARTQADVADLFRQVYLVSPAGEPADVLPISTVEPAAARNDDVVWVAAQTRGSPPWVLQCLLLPSGLRR